MGSVIFSYMGEYMEGLILPCFVGLGTLNTE